LPCLISHTINQRFLSEGKRRALLILALTIHQFLND
jgi:hypothetical protein